ncbi:MAG: lytic murein transglycosylase [Microbacterium sp.]
MRRWSIALLPVVVVALAVGVLLVTAASLLRAGGDGEAAATATPATADTTPAAVDVPAGIAGLADPAWIARLAASTGIPERALAAYAGAALAIVDEYPRCGLGWNTLAGIGYVETEHGAFGGSQIDDDGVARPRIVGRALDGDGVQAIADTDDGALDGDAEWDHAVGPMQFIPSTWELYARDGDGDGAADIDDIDDAVLTAAAYLCETGGDLTVAANWIAAVAAYNDDVAYNNAVVDAADRYATAG